MRLPASAPRRGMYLVILLACFVSLTASGCGPTPSYAHPRVTFSPSVGGLTWSDEFDGPAGSAPDSTKWGHDLGSDGWGDNELQYYTPSTDNVALDGAGHLVLTARRENIGGHPCWNGPCQYSSGRLSTAHRFTQTYGTFEARIKVPPGRGMLPAFWMIGEDISTAGWPECGEIDVMEYPGQERGSIYGSVHGPGYSRGGKYTLPNARAFADDFHTFTVHWAPEAIAYWVDGVQYKVLTPSDIGNHRWAYDHPFFVVVNLAVGGKWAGPPDAHTVFPQHMLIDYVRIYAWNSGSPAARLDPAS